LGDEKSTVKGYHVLEKETARFRTKFTQIRTHETDVSEMQFSPEPRTIDRVRIIVSTRRGVGFRKNTRIFTFVAG
jgi:hypothetical protein